MTSQRYTLSKTLASGLPELAAALCVLLVGALAWPYTVDDAYIVARYAQNVAAGDGYGMNSQEPSDGLTGPLWLLPELLGRFLGAPALLGAKALGLACAAGAAFAVTRRLRGRARGRAMAWTCAAALGVSPSIATWAVSGLETGTATLLIVVAVLAATSRLRARLRSDMIVVGACIGLLAWLRPELAVVGAGVLGLCVLRARRAAWPAIALAVLGAASVIAFRVVLFSRVLPMSFAAKAGSLGEGARYTWVAIVLATSVAGAVIAARGALRGRRDDRALAALLLMHLIACVIAGGDWMPGYRLLVPVLPLYAMLLAVGVAQVRSRAVALASLVLACSVPTLDLATRIPELRAAASSQRGTEALAKWLVAHASSVALVDVGQLGYETGLPVVDLAGLTDARVAAMPGGHLDKHIDPEYLRERAPQAIVLHASSPPEVDADGTLRNLRGYPVERRVAALRHVRQGYRVVHQHVHAPGYHYVVLMALRDR